MYVFFVIGCFCLVVYMDDCIATIAPSIVELISTIIRRSVSLRLVIVMADKQRRNGAVG